MAAPGALLVTINDLARGTHALAWWTQILAISTCVLAALGIISTAATIIFFRRQLVDAKTTERLRLHLQHVRWWDSARLIKERSALAAALIGQRKPYPHEATAVLDVLDGLAYDVNRRELDEERVWNDFGLAVRCYWHRLESYVNEKLRPAHPLLYSELKTLYYKVNAVERKKRPERGTAIEPRPEEIDTFLHMEQTLEDAFAAMISRPNAAPHK